MSTCIVTCGPAFAEIDAVRRITNFSTGELGVLLTEALAEAGHRVICCKGQMASWRDPAKGEVRHFGGNADLLRILEDIAAEEGVGHIFHAAALSDFRVARLTDSTGNKLLWKKIPSSASEFNVHLVPAVKLLPELPKLFPAARVIGWKYELDGTRDDAIERGRHQILANGISACVVNGAAYGSGFGLLTVDSHQHFASKDFLSAHLVRAIGGS